MRFCSGSRWRNPERFVMYQSAACHVAVDVRERRYDQVNLAKYMSLPAGSASCGDSSPTNRGSVWRQPQTRAPPLPS